MIVFITGISSGFGLETARLLAQEGHTVYGTVRRAVEPLSNVHYLTLDVRDREADAGTCPGDDGGFSIEIQIVFFFKHSGKVGPCCGLHSGMTA